MKKIVSFVLLFALSLSLAACGKKEVSTVADKASTPMPKEQQKQEKNLRGWMEAGESVKCKIKLDGETEMLMMAKDEKVRIEGLPYFSMTADFDEADMENTDGVSLTVGDWTYMWNKETKEGTKFNLKDMEALGENFEDYDEEGEDGDEDFESWEDQVDNWEDDGVDYDCDQVKLDDDLFEEPKDVNFTDMGDMMKGMAEIGENMEHSFEAGELPDMEALKDLLPEGMELPEMPTE